MATRQITIDLKTILDSGWAYGVVSFEMITDVATSGTTVYPQSLQKIQTDVDGVGTVNLAVPTTGAFVYEVRLPSTQEAQIVVAAGATVTLAELLVTGLTPVPPSGDSYWVRLDGTNTPMTGDLSFASAGIVDADTVGFNELYVTTGLEPVGTQYWDSVREEMAFTVDDFGSITIGKEIWDKMTNLSGVQVVNGDIVSTASATGNRQAFTLTDATDTAKSIACIGMVTVPTINANASGRITKSGIVRGLNTDAFTEGSIVYVDPLNPGKLTQTQPQAPNFTIAVGTVTVKHPTEGVINVNIRIVSKFVDSSDVNGTPLDTTGQFPVWDQTGQYFDFTSNVKDFSPTLSNVLYVDQSFTSATVGWGVYAFADLALAVAAADVSGVYDTIVLSGTLSVGDLGTVTSEMTIISDFGRITGLSAGITIGDGGFLLMFGGKSSLLGVTLAHSSAKFYANSSDIKGVIVTAGDQVKLLSVELDLLDMVTAVPTTLDLQGCRVSVITTPVAGTPTLGIYNSELGSAPTGSGVFDPLNDTNTVAGITYREVVALASLPLASTVPGAIAATSDGGTGSTPALMYSNGTVWDAYYPITDFSASPGAAEAPLKTTVDGGITLQSLTVQRAGNATSSTITTSSNTYSRYALGTNNGTTAAMMIAYGTAHPSTPNQLHFRHDYGNIVFRPGSGGSVVDAMTLASSGTVLAIDVPTASTIGHVIKLAPSQTANGFEQQDSATAIQFAIGATGQIKTNQDAANTNTPAGATAHQLPIYNEAGTLLGYIPVYGSAW